MLPLVLGISIVAFILTATIALSPSEDETRGEAELMRRVDSLRTGKRLTGPSRMPGRRPLRQ